MSTHVFEIKWWYRLLKVLFILSGLILIAGGVIIAALSIKEEVSNYQFSRQQHNRSEGLKQEIRSLAEEYGNKLPVIDSLQNISNTEKGIKAYQLTEKGYNDSYYINSKNHNGYHYLMGDQEKVYLELNDKIKQGLSLQDYFNPPQSPQKSIEKIISILIAYLTIVSAFLWLIRRLFFYIVTGDKFFKV